MKKILTTIIILMFSLSVLSASFNLDSFNYSPSPVPAGETFDLLLQVKNTSNLDAENVEVSLDLDWPFTATGKTTESIQSIKANRISIIEFKGLKIDSEAETGTYELNINYKDKTGAPQKKNVVKISVLAEKPKIELIKSSEQEIGLGETKKFEFTFKNIGSETAKDIVVSFQEDRIITSTGEIIEREIIPLGSTSMYINELKPREEKTISFLLSANNNAELKNYTLPMNVKFMDSKNNEYTSTVYAGVKINANPELDVAINSVEALYPGAEKEIIFDIFNIGKASALYTVLELQSSDLVFNKTKTFIGTLEADDFDSFKTKIKIPKNIETGVKKINVIFHYKDAKGVSEKTIQKTINLKIVPASQVKENQNLVGNVFGLIINILALIGLFFVGKKIYLKIKK